MKLRILNAADVERLLPMSKALELMKVAFSELSQQRMQSPVRTLLPNDRGTMLYKPAYWPAKRLYACKTVAVFPENSHQGLPVTGGVILANDGETGQPIALLEAGYLTALRTGAAAGLAVDLLAPQDANTAALFGTGGQARHQLEALLNVRQLERIHVFSRQPDRAGNFCKIYQELAQDCELVPSSDLSPLGDCQIIMAATTSPTPLFPDSALPRQIHISASGSLGPQRTEIAPETILRAEVVVDHRETCLQEAGEFLPLLADGRLPQDFNPLELGELVDGQVRKSSRPCTVFKSVGNAAQDIVCVEYLLARATDDDLGDSIILA